ncbi:hypothetical protein N3K63_13960 [Microbacterium sp. W1N]|uniref:hypothetical protein n=1 Tax=Microbacterium festucae TaxID=2977531 RepID=UPI0021BE9334|nr:hypothetical protein [Microbacterium festucae]MCT9821385.1 hypothetical protein [Microbacterium festucae]
MSKEEKARDGAQSVIPDDEIIDVALVEARGATSSGVVGAVLGMGGNRGVAWGFAGAAIGQRVNASLKGVYPTYVLAVSATTLYLLGRQKSGSVGGWKKLEPITQIDRSNLAVARKRHGTVSTLELTDTSTGATLEFEPKRIGNLGLKDLLAELG